MSIVALIWTRQCIITLGVQNGRMVTIFIYVFSEHLVIRVPSGTEIIRSYYY